MVAVYSAYAKNRKMHTSGARLPKSLTFEIQCAGFTFVGSAGSPRDQKVRRYIYIYTDRGLVEFDKMARFVLRNSGRSLSYSNNGL